MLERRLDPSLLYMRSFELGILAVGPERKYEYERAD